MKAESILPVLSKMDVGQEKNIPDGESEKPVATDGGNEDIS